MESRLRLALCVLLLAGCSDHDDSDSGPVAADQWEIGPKGYSIGMPLHPTPVADGWAFDFGPDAEPHYVTIAHRPLGSAGKIVMSYRVEAAPGTMIYGKGCPTSSPSYVTPYFQREGDDWNTDGYRWWATFASKKLEPGTFTIEAPLGDNWTSVETMTADKNRDEFLAAKLRTSRVGFTFSNCEGYGHGARATGPVRFTILAYQVL